jgi:Ca2+-binding EF-hand superfamily protein
LEYFDKDNEVLCLIEQKEETTNWVNEKLLKKSYDDGQINYDEFKTMMKFNQGIITNKKQS